MKPTTRRAVRTHRQRYEAQASLTVLIRTPLNSSEPLALLVEEVTEIPYATILPARCEESENLQGTQPRYQLLQHAAFDPPVRARRERAEPALLAQGVRRDQLPARHQNLHAIYLQPPRIGSPLRVPVGTGAEGPFAREIQIDQTDPFLV